jgi:Ran GTPase-activating protein (RanGAP) involved in mRNA processing and transport
VSTQHSIVQSLNKRREAKRLEQDRPASKLRDRYISVVFSDAVPVVPEEETLEELKERQIENRELFSKLLTGQGVLDASSLMRLDLDLEQEGTNASRIKRWEKASNVVQAKLANDLIPLDDSYNSHLFKEESFEMSWQEEYLSTCMQLNMAPSSTCLKEMAKPTALLNHLLLKMNGSKAISAALPYNQTITTLLLEDNNLGPGSLKYLVRGLAMNRMVTTLDLSYNPMGSQGSTIVAELVEMKNKHRTSCAQLETLVLNACFIDDTGAGALAFSLLGNHKLKVLHLKNNKIGDQGVEQLADMLADQHKLSYLKELNLAWNNFGHAGAMAIAEALKVNIRLTHLYMPWNGLESEGTMFICAALSENATLNLLDLSHTRAGPETCLVLSAALRLNDTLEQLHLNGNPLGADGGRHLMWGLHVSKSITTLGVQGCVFAKEGPVADMVGFADVNLQHPDDHYELNLAKPVQRSVALELFHVNRQLGDSSIKRIKLQKQWYTETCAKLAEDMPHTGVLEFDFGTQAAVSGEGRGILLAGPKEIGAVQRQFSDVKTSNTSRASFLEVLASHFFFTCHSAACILSTFEYGDEQVDAAVKLFMRSCDSENFRHMVAGLVSPQVNEKIMDAIGLNIQVTLLHISAYVSACAATMWRL